MTKYQKQILRIFKTLLSYKGFKLASHSVDYIHAAEICELQGKQIRLRCILHKSESIIEVNPGFDDHSWFPFHLVRYALTKEPQSTGDTSAENAAFIAERLSEITALLKEKGIKRDLDRYGKQYQAQNEMWLKKK